MVLQHDKIQMPLGKFLSLMYCLSLLNTLEERTMYIRALQNAFQLSAPQIKCMTEAFPMEERMMALMGLLGNIRFPTSMNEMMRTYRRNQIINLLRTGRDRRDVRLTFAKSVLFFFPPGWGGGL